MFGWKLDMLCALRGHDDDVTAFYLDRWNQTLIRDHGPDDGEEDPYEEYGGEA